SCRGIVASCPAESTESCPALRTVGARPVCASEWPASETRMVATPVTRAIVRRSMQPRLVIVAMKVVGATNRSTFWRDVVVANRWPLAPRSRRGGGIRFGGLGPIHNNQEKRSNEDQCFTRRIPGRHGSALGVHQ